jgi:hypothetical protein
LQGPVNNRLALFTIYASESAMEPQTIINVTAGAILAVTGWFARVLWDSVNQLKEDIHALERDLPISYVRKQDFTDMMNSINTKLDRIYDKLENKVDR